MNKYRWERSDVPRPLTYILFPTYSNKVIWIRETLNTISPPLSSILWRGSKTFFIVIFQERWVTVVKFYTRDLDNIVKEIYVCSTISTLFVYYMIFSGQTMVTSSIIVIYCIAISIKYIVTQLLAQSLAPSWYFHLLYIVLDLVCLYNAFNLGMCFKSSNKVIKCNSHSITNLPQAS